MTDAMIQKLSKWCIIVFGSLFLALIVYAVGWAEDCRDKPGEVCWDTSDSLTIGVTDPPEYTLVPGAVFHVEGMDCKLECEVQHDKIFFDQICYDSEKDSWISCGSEPVHNGDKLCQLWCKEKPKKKLKPPGLLYMGDILCKNRPNGTVIWDQRHLEYHYCIDGEDKVLQEK